MSKKADYETIVLGSGCFWCGEAVFKMVKGVVSVLPGYSGGYLEDPTYEQVGNGSTGHAETIKVEFDPKQISFNNLLTVFFATHDPTTLNRQGSDIGPQYRSMILCPTLEQKIQAEEFINRLKKEEALNVVTEVKLFDKFYEAEDYHHDYYAKNKNAAYCQLIINPKLAKLKSKLPALLK